MKTVKTAPSHGAPHPQSHEHWPKTLRTTYDGADGPTGINKLRTSDFKTEFLNEGMTSQPIPTKPA